MHILCYFVQCISKRSLSLLNYHIKKDECFPKDKTVFKIFLWYKTPNPIICGKMGSTFFKHKYVLEKEFFFKATNSEFM